MVPEGRRSKKIQAIALQSYKIFTLGPRFTSTALCSPRKKNKQSQKKQYYKILKN